MPSRRILVIQRAYLGDLILTLPLVRKLHGDDPDAEITLAVRRGFEDVVSDQPGVAAVLAMRKRRGLFERLGHDRGTFRALRAGRFDEVYLAHRSFRSGLYARVTGAPRRVGFDGSSGQWACTERVRYDSARHLAERLLSLAGVAPGTTNFDEPSFHVAPAAREEAVRHLRQAELDSDGPFVCIAPGSSWETKRWTPEGFASVARRLAAQGLPTVLVGSPEEMDLCEAIRAVAGEGVSNLAGTSIPVMAAMLQSAQLAIGNDSGAGHLAAAVGTPVVTIFGPTAPELGYLPLGPRSLAVETTAPLDCRPCGRHGAKRCPFGHHRCMKELTADAVYGRLAAWELSGLRDTPPALHARRSSHAQARRG